MKAVHKRAVGTNDTHRRLYNLRMRAEVMGRRRGVTVSLSADTSTGQTDGRNIAITAAAYGDDPDAIDLLEGIGDHEWMHIRYTDFDAKLPILNQPLALSFYRSLEDSRGEMRQRRDYPGTARIIERALGVLVKRGRYPLPQPGEAPSSLFAGMLLGYVRGVLLGQSPVAELYPAYRAILASMVGDTVLDGFIAIADRIVDAPRTQDSVEIALALQDYLKDLVGTPSPVQPPCSEPTHSMPSPAGDSNDTEEGQGAQEPENTSLEESDESSQNTSGEPGKSDSDVDQPTMPGGAGAEEHDSDGTEPEGAEGSGKSTNSVQAEGDESSNPGEQDTRGEASDEPGSGQSGSAASDSSAAEVPSSSSGNTGGTEAEHDGLDQSSDSMPQEGDAGQDGAHSGGQSGVQSSQGAGNQADGSDKVELPPGGIEAIRQALQIGDDDLPSMDLGDVIQREIQRIAPPAYDPAIPVGSYRDNAEALVRYEALARGIELRIASSMEVLIESLVEARTHISDSGRRIAPRRLTRVRTSLDHRVFRTEEEIPGVNTVVCVLTDISASMNTALLDRVSRLAAATAASRAAVAALDRHEVPVALYWFGSTITAAKTYDEPWRRTRDRYWIREENNTLTGQAVEAVAPSLALREEERKLLLLVTDGVPADPTRAVAALQECGRFGIEIALLIINSVSSTENSLMQAFKGLLMESGIPWIEVSSSEQLADGLIGAIRQAF